MKREEEEQNVQGMPTFKAWAEKVEGKGERERILNRKGSITKAKERESVKKGGVRYYRNV